MADLFGTKIYKCLVALLKNVDFTGAQKAACEMKRSNGLGPNLISSDDLGTSAQFLLFWRMYFKGSLNFGNYYEWRRQDFVLGFPGHLKANMRLPQGVRMAEAAWMVTKFKILKRIQLLENESIY